MRIVIVGGGAIGRYAEESGINVPTHHTMMELIRLLECWKPEVEAR